MDWSKFKINPEKAQEGVHKSENDLSSQETLRTGLVRRTRASDGTIAWVHERRGTHCSVCDKMFIVQVTQHPNHSWCTVCHDKFELLRLHD